MLSGLKFRIALSRLRHEQRKIDSDYVKAIGRAKAEGSEKDVIASINFVSM
jgi:hypothetical protein